jgi:exodeoxyribonuclease V alpha subunit
MIGIRTGISYALTEAMDEGRCGLPTGELLPLAAGLLDAPQELVEAHDRRPHSREHKANN